MASFSSTDPPRRRYDVFLSFRGTDTRYTFTCYLHNFLRRKGIDAFFDQELRRGNDLSSLFETIEQSKISIVIFSENYANSAWCLEELAKVIECRDRFNQVVFPVFYGVNKSDVENQTGNFGAPFENPKESFKEFKHRIPVWKKALKIASNIAGYVLPENSPQSDFVDRIAKETLKMLNKLSPSETWGLVGMQSRLEGLENLLSFDESSCVRTVGVLGMAGIGKTTIADCLYKRISGLFDGCCFLANIHDESRIYGLDNLQQKLLCKLLDEDHLDIAAPDSAHDALKDRLQNKKLLIVLDGVTHEKQIRLLLGQRKWFRDGSRIIITTRDKKLIEKIVDDTYVVPRLNGREALELFSLNAFTNNFCPAAEFMELSNKFADYAKGHPLALKLLGSDLCHREMWYWKSKFERLQSKPDGKIQEIFEMSYEELSLEQRNLFLDIACFFRSENADYVASILDSDRTDAATVINDLVDKCLISISDNRLEMHDLLHTIGKEIGYEASKKEAGNRSRLWVHDDVCRVLKNKTGTGELRGISLDMSKVEKMNLSSDVFMRMWNLRFLKFYNCHCSRGCENESRFHFPEGLDSLPDELTCLYWPGYPLEHLPSNFNPKKLVDLNLRCSHIIHLWQDDKKTERLKWLDLSHSRELLSLSGLLEAPNLERLILEGCTSLARLSSSLRNMNSLVSLNLRGCTSLKRLPKGMNLISLKTLILSGCSNLKKFRLISENIEALYLDGTAIKELPASIENLHKLYLLNLKGCNKLKHLPDNLCKLKSLHELILSGCSSLMTLPEIQEDMDCLEILLLDQTAIQHMPRRMLMSNLKTFSFCGSNSQDSTSLLLPPLSGCSQLTYLYLTDCNLYRMPDGLSYLSSLRSVCLSKNNIESLPECIKLLHHLKSLDLKHCLSLKSLPVLPLNLQYLDCHGCVSLEIVANPLMLLQLAERFHYTFIFTNCFKLNQSARDSITAHAQIKSQLMSNSSLKHHHKGLVLEPLVSICFPGTEIPLWFCHQRTGYSLKTELPPHWCHSKFAGFSLCIVVSFKNYNNPSNRFSVKCLCKFENEDGDVIRLNCTLGGWNEICGSPGHPPRQLSSDHVILNHINYFDIQKRHVDGNNLGKCCETTASFKFYVMDDAMRRIENCEVMKCGMNLLYAPDEDDCRFIGLRDTNIHEAKSEKEMSCHAYASSSIDQAGGSKRGRCHTEDEEIRNPKRKNGIVPVSVFEKA